MTHASPPEAKRATEARLELPVDARYRSLAGSLARLLGVDGALVALRPSVHGVPLRDASRRPPPVAALALWAIARGEPVHVADVARDARLRAQPGVEGSPRVRFFASEPLHGDGARAIGALCAWDARPRSLEPREVELMRDFARWAESVVRADHLAEAQRELLGERRRLRERATHDPLTHLWNREEILHALERELARTARGQGPLSLMLVDVDHFKRVNDRHGHLHGDLVLREVAARLADSVRRYDAVGRYGGDEFVAVLPGCSLAAAHALAERLRALLGRRTIRAGRNVLRIQVSAGVATSVGASVGAAELLAAADRALYRAKSLGRDRVEDEPDVAPSARARR